MRATQHGGDWTAWWAAIRFGTPTYRLIGTRSTRGCGDIPSRERVTTLADAVEYVVRVSVPGDCAECGGPGIVFSTQHRGLLAPRMSWDALVGRGDRVTVVDDLSTGKRSNLASAIENGAHLVVADVQDAGAMHDVMAAAQPEVVFHLAAQIDVRRSVDDLSTTRT